jgi:hypothetical protein
MEALPGIAGDRYQTELCRIEQGLTRLLERFRETIEPVPDTDGYLTE